MAAHPFLSDAWIEAAREVRESFADRLPAPVADVSVNLVVTDGPDGATVEAHLDTHSGALDVDLGHVDAPDATITVDHDTARVLLVSRDPAAAMQAFMSGRIQVEGDVIRVMALQAGPTDLELAEEIASALEAITD